MGIVSRVRTVIEWLKIVVVDSYFYCSSDSSKPALRSLKISEWIEGKGSFVFRAKICRHNKYRSHTSRFP